MAALALDALGVGAIAQIIDREMVEMFIAAGDLGMAAKYSRIKGVNHERFSDIVSTCEKDCFNRPVEMTMGQYEERKAEAFKREQAAADKARDRCLLEGSTDPVVHKRYYDEAMAASA